MEIILLLLTIRCDRPDRGLEDLYALLREVETLGFDCQEVVTLRNLAQQAEETKTKAAALLNATPPEDEREDFLQECKRLLVHGSSLNVLLDELNEVEKIVDHGRNPRKEDGRGYFWARYRSGRFRWDSLHLPWKDKLPSRISDR